MELVAYDHHDEARVLASLQVLNAARAVDTPFLWPIAPFRRRAYVEGAWSGSTSQHLLGCDGDVPVVVAELEIGDYDNRDFGWADVLVHPSYRRRGIGTTVAHRLMDLARERGCTRFGGSGWDLPATEPFATSVGCTRAAVEAFRMVLPQDLPPGHVQGAYDEAAGALDDYELVRYAGRTPDGLVDAVAVLTAVINDAPVDDLEVEDEQFPPERVRAYEDGLLAAGYRLYRVLARRRSTGELAGHTVVLVDSELPERARQHDTAVAREHRGHRLGLLLKADMMRWLAEEEPAIETIDTWNAESNPHMVVVNERLGYRLFQRELEFQRRL